MHPQSVTKRPLKRVVRVALQPVLSNREADNLDNPADLLRGRTKTSSVVVPLRVTPRGRTQVTSSAKMDHRNAIISHTRELQVIENTLQTNTTNASPHPTGTRTSTLVSAVKIRS